MSLAMPRFYVYVGLHSLFARRGGEGLGERGGGQGAPVGEGGEVEGERGGGRGAPVGEGGEVEGERGGGRGAPVGRGHTMSLQ